MQNVLGDGEFSKVVANHLGLDFDLVELLTGVDTDNGADHLGDDDHVTEVSLNEVGLLVGLSLLLGLTELLDEAHGLALQATVEPTASAGVNDIAELFGREVEEPVIRPCQKRRLCKHFHPLHPTPTRINNRILDAIGHIAHSESGVGGTGVSSSCHVLVEVNTAVGKLAEGSLGLDSCKPITSQRLVRLIPR